jgi:hypothetical protein
MSDFSREDYAYLKHLLMTKPDDTKALLSNNFNIILGALEIAAAHDAPRTAEPEADGDRTVHPAMDRAPATELLRRVTELEKLVNETAKCVLNPFPMARSTNALEQVRTAWLKTRAGEWL